MFGRSVLQRLAATNPGTEIWWDSSPLVFESWRAEILDAIVPKVRQVLEEDLLRLWNPAEPEATLFRGVTTNPSLSLAAIRDDPYRWSQWIRTYHAAHPDGNDERTFWALYKEIARLGAAAFKPVFEATGYRYGHVSVQVDVGASFDTEAMLHQALELARLGPNIMIKVPATREGMPVLRELTSRGISTNCTLAYTVSQFVAAAEEVQAGLLDARAADIDLTGWRSVVTDMAARWENTPAFAAEARSVGLELSAEDRRWAGIGVFRQAQRIFRRGGYPSKMLLCSVRMGPELDGEERCWHLEHTAGADAVFTLPPAFLTPFLQRCSTLVFAPHIWEGIPPDVNARLRRVRYFERAYELDRISVEEFNQIAPLQSTVGEFANATEQMVAFVQNSLRQAPRDLAAASARSRPDAIKSIRGNGPVAAPSIRPCPRSSAAVQSERPQHAPVANCQSGSVERNA